MYWVCCVVSFNISEVKLVEYKFILLENFIFMKIGVNFVPKSTRHTIGEMYFWDRQFELWIIAGRPQNPLCINIKKSKKNTKMLKKTKKWLLLFFVVVSSVARVLPVSNGGGICWMAFSWTCLMLLLSAGFVSSLKMHNTKKIVIGIVSHSLRCTVLTALHFLCYWLKASALFQ